MDRSANAAHNQKLFQYKLSEVGIRKQVKLSLNGRNELKSLSEKWICKDLQAFTIVEDYALESLASMLIKISKKIDHKLISEFISPYSFL